LVRGWTHLERQKGGIGLRGPGETQLETDRRLLNKRIKYLNSRLDKVARQREQSRQARKKADIPTISLVGYTNAGKSTLFNCLTESNAYAANKLFATLDPTIRKLDLDDQSSVILADTVGFIRHLPHDLVAAFRATLIETREADLILHVVDCADDDRREKMFAVNQVLEEINASETPQLVIYNKIDLPDFQPRIDVDEEGCQWRVWLSAQKNQGIDGLLNVLKERFFSETTNYELSLAANEGKIRAILYEQGAIEEEVYEDNGDIALKLRLSPTHLKRLTRKHGVAEDRFTKQLGILAGVA
jgi:GTP-binding protein HflX